MRTLNDVASMADRPFHPANNVAGNSGAHIEKARNNLLPRAGEAQPAEATRVV